MRIYVIDDNEEYFEKLKKDLFSKYEKLTLEYINPEKIVSFNDFANDFAIKNSNIIDCIIFINLNFKYKFYARQNLKGIELFKWLRIKDCYHHCVLYSAFSLNYLLKEDSGNIILGAKGSSFYRNPQDLLKLDLLKLSTHKAEINNLKEYSQKSFNINMHRHQFANWWGVKCLWDVYNFYTNKEMEYPLPIREKFQTYDGALSQFIYLSNKDSITKKIGEIVNKNEVISVAITEILDPIKQKINELETIHNQLENSKDEKQSKLELLKNLLTTLQENIPQTRNIEQYKESQDVILNTHNEIVEKLSTDIMLLRNRISRFESLQLYTEEKITDTESIIYEIRESINKTFEMYEKKYSRIDEKIKKINTKSILYIDDQAENGWKEILSMVLNNQLITVPKELFLQSQIENKLFPTIKMLINDRKPDCILLDLRLKDEKGIIPNVRVLSGAKILEKIKNKFPSLPVIIITASNKAYSLRELMELKAFDMWTKEGIDEDFSTDNSVNNYFRLIDIVYNAVSEYEVPFNRAKLEIEYEIDKLKNPEYIIPDKVLKNILNAEGTEFKLSDIDTFVFDTNFFLASDTKYNDFKREYEVIPDSFDNFTINLKAFINLVKYCNQNDNKILIHHKVFFELCKHKYLTKGVDESQKDKEFEYKDNSQKADYVLRLITDETSDSIQSIKKGEIKWGGFNFYADEDLFKFITDNSSETNKILLLSWDKELLDKLALRFYTNPNLQSNLGKMINGIKKGIVSFGDYVSKTILDLPKYVTITSLETPKQIITRNTINELNQSIPYSIFIDHDKPKVKYKQVEARLKEYENSHKCKSIKWSNPIKINFKMDKWEEVIESYLDFLYNEVYADGNYVDQNNVFGVSSSDFSQSIKKK